MLQMQCVVVETPLGSKAARVLMGDAGEPVKAPVKVYRIEMPNGNGPYNSCLSDSKSIYMKLCLPPKFGGYDCARLARENKEQMGITDQPFRDAHGHANYGCLKIDDIHDWFPEGARKLLAGYGAKIAEYEIPVGGYMLKVHDKEVIFNRHECRKVGDHELS